MGEQPARTPVERRRRRRILGCGALLAYLTFAMFGGCADSLLLFPTNGVIATDGAIETQVPVAGATPVQVFQRTVNVSTGAQPEAFILVFDGNGGRAENAIFWGDDIARSHPVEVWAMNYPGFGGSPGKAKLAALPVAGLAAYDAIKAKAGDRPVIIWGASMGSTVALHIAANRPVAGLVLTNPPPLKQLILGRYGWWNLWLLAWPVSNGVPAELDSLANAAKVTCPAVIVTAANDFTVPADYQQRVIDAYAGPKQLVGLPNAGHNTPASHANPTGWYAAIDWLWTQVRGAPATQPKP